MENVTNGGSHRGPVQVIIKPEALARERAERKGKKHGKGKTGGETAAERKKRRARIWYQANKVRLATAARDRYRKEHGIKTVRGPPKGNDGPVRTGNRTDALIYLNKAIGCVDQKDWEGVELFAKLCRRVLKGKE